MGGKKGLRKEEGGRVKRNKGVRRKERDTKGGMEDEGERGRAVRKEKGDAWEKDRVGGGTAAGKARQGGEEKECLGFVLYRRI